MDRPGRVLIWAAAALAFAACATTIGAQDGPISPLRQLAWIGDKADAVTALTERSVPCLRPADTPAERARIRQGELAFSNPLLLGGQAAKIGLSCASCHQNGRGNPNFFIAAVSDRAGRADVSSGVFSRVRADDVFNPLDIPDLAMPEGQDLIDRSDRAALETFTRDQIVEEFSGPPPAPAVMAGLLSYLQAIDAEACDGNAREALTWQTHWQDTLDAYAVALEYDAAGDGPAAAFFVSTAREKLGLLHERYQTVSDGSIQQAIRQLSRDMQAGKVDLEAVHLLAKGLEAEHEQSMYNPDALRAHLERRSERP